MNIAGKDLLDHFKRKHPNSRAPIDRWIQAVSNARWKKFKDVKETFNSVDKVREHLIFNIKGNDYRLLARVVFEVGLVIIKEIMDHKTYDRKKFK